MILSIIWCVQFHYYRLAVSPCLFFFIDSVAFISAVMLIGVQTPLFTVTDDHIARGSWNITRKLTEGFYISCTDTVNNSLTRPENKYKRAETIYPYCKSETSKLLSSSTRVELQVSFYPLTVPFTQPLLSISVNPTVLHTWYIYVSIIPLLPMWMEFGFNNLQSIIHIFQIGALKMGTSS